MRGEPVIAVAAVAKPRVSTSSPITSDRFQELMYYLTAFAPHDMTAAVLVRHGFMERACDHILKHSLPPKVCFSPFLPASDHSFTCILRCLWTLSSYLALLMASLGYYSSI